jgi:hypothetical protein
VFGSIINRLDPNLTLNIYGCPLKPGFLKNNANLVYVIVYAKEGVEHNRKE